MDTATILITHNLGIVAGVCDRVAVMYGGRIVEIAPRDPLFAEPRHPYTLGLLDCVPRVDRLTAGVFQSIPGQPPDLWARPPVARSRRAARYATERCTRTRRSSTPPDTDHRAACWNQARTCVARARPVRRRPRHGTVDRGERARPPAPAVVDVRDVTDALPGRSAVAASVAGARWSTPSTACR